MTQEYIPTDEEMRHCFEPSYSPNIDPLGQIDDPERGEIYDRWIAAHDAQTRAAAWDEGFAECRDLAVAGQLMSRNNPYKEQKQ